MDADRIEFRLAMIVLAGGSAGFAGSLLLPWSVPAAWAAAAVAGAATLAALRSGDPVDLPMARRVRLYFAFAFGFVLTRLAVPSGDWYWWMPAWSAAAMFLLALPFLPSRRQRGRMARAFPEEGVDPGEGTPPGRGWWWGYYLSCGALLSLVLKAGDRWGWVGAVALLLAVGAPLNPLRRLAKRRELLVRPRSESKGDPAPLFPDRPG